MANETKRLVECIDGLVKTHDKTLRLASAVAIAEDAEDARNDRIGWVCIISCLTLVLLYFTGSGIYGFIHGLPYDELTLTEQGEYFYGAIMLALGWICSILFALELLARSRKTEDSTVVEVRHE